jgi:formate-dependent nitrite reductase membrane component NrfD
VNAPAGGGRDGGRGGKRRSGGEQPVVPKAELTSYYGLPILNAPVWRSPDIPGYLFLGGLAGASSVLAAGAQLTGRPELAKRTKMMAGAAIALGTVGLVNDLGRPSRFYNMLRVLKPTSPMSVGSWLLAAYAPAAMVSAATVAVGRLPRINAAATAAAALVGPAIATYTAALISDTAVPAWHDAYREMPFVFAGSSAAAAGGMGLVCAPSGQSEPALRLALIGAATETIAVRCMQQRLGVIAEPYQHGRAGWNLKVARTLTVAGAAAAVLGRRHRAVRVAGGAALAAGSAFTRFGIFEAGKQSARDPSYTVEPQRRRLAAN